MTFLLKKSNYDCDYLPNGGKTSSCWQKGFATTVFFLWKEPIISIHWQKLANAR